MDSNRLARQSFGMLKFAKTVYFLSFAVVGITPQYLSYAVVVILGKKSFCKTSFN